MYRLRWFLGLVAVVLLFVAGCSSDSGETSDDAESAENNTGAVAEDTANAEEIYSGNCASCHGGNLEGGMGPSLETVGANMSETEIADVIKNGRGQMPAITQLQDDEVQELASWLAEKK